MPADLTEARLAWAHESVAPSAGGQRVLARHRRPEDGLPRLGRRLENRLAIERASRWHVGPRRADANGANEPEERVVRVRLEEARRLVAKDEERVRHAGRERDVIAWRDHQRL